jgi:cytokinin trans-hydroxylase
MVECTKQTIRALQEAALASSPSPGGGRCREVEIGGYMTRLTGDIISRT